MFETVVLWVALIAGLYMAWNIGANDVANAFGTSVGSGALNLRGALVLAAIFEFAGAYFVGSYVSDTIRGNIVRPELFQGDPRQFAVGMLAGLLAASIWLNVATYLGQPVSTTHAIIGGVIGFGLVFHGPGCIQWHKLGRIVASWFVSPVAGAALSFALYYLIRKYVLKSEQAHHRARIVVPLGLAIVVFILVYSVMEDVLVRRLPPAVFGMSRSWFGAGVSGLLAAVSWAASRWWIGRRGRQGSEPVAAAEESLERWFGSLQILTACYMAFAHGANDVANAIGPIAGVVQALKGEVMKTASVPTWMLALGGAGIVVGLGTYGAKVIEAVGSKITEITPSRGFAAQFGTATTVLVCSRMGLPLSTTFVLVGSVLGVGLARGIAAIDLRMVKSIFMSWLVTIPICAAGTAAICLIAKPLMD